MTRKELFQITKGDVANESDKGYSWILNILRTQAVEGKECVYISVTPIVKDEYIMMLLKNGLTVRIVKILSGENAYRISWNEGW